MLTLRRSRAGFTLVEILVVLVLMGIFAAAMVKLLLRQQRFYNSTNELIQTRQQIRQAAFMLPADLRGISRLGADIYAMTDSSIEFRSVFGSSVVCMVNSAGAWISTVPVQLAKGSAMSNWKLAPAVNDSVAMYDDGTNIGSQDDSWRYSRITAVSLVTGNNVTGCPTTSNLVQPADLTASNPSDHLTLSPAPLATTVQGASIRFFRRVHYSLYKWPTDGKWYLAYYDCVPLRVPACTTPPQPIAGPLRPYAAPATTSGLEFTYYDSTGAVTATKTQVARVSVVVRGQGQTNINLTGEAAIPLRDSMRVEVGLRNRN